LEQLDQEPDQCGGEDQHEQGEDPTDPRVLAPLRRGAPAGLGRTSGASVALPATRSAVGGAVALALEPRLLALLSCALEAVRQGTPHFPSCPSGRPASPRAGAPQPGSPRPPSPPCARPAAW